MARDLPLISIEPGNIAQQARFISQQISPLRSGEGVINHNSRHTSAVAQMLTKAEGTPFGEGSMTPLMMNSRLVAPSEERAGKETALLMMPPSPRAARSGVGSQVEGVAKQPSEPPSLVAHKEIAIAGTVFKNTKRYPILENTELKLHASRGTYAKIKIATMPAIKLPKIAKKSKK